MSGETGGQEPCFVSPETPHLERGQEGEPQVTALTCFYHLTSIHAAQFQENKQQITPVHGGLLPPKPGEPELLA